MRGIGWLNAVLVMVWLGAVPVMGATFPDNVFPNTAGLQLKNGDMTSQQLGLAESTGLKYARKGIVWSTIEFQKGVYDWSTVDTWIQDMEARGFSMSLTIVWNNRLYEDIYDRAIVTEEGRHE